MIFAKSLLFPSFWIPTITTPSISLFENDFMALMVTIFEAVHANYAASVSSAVIAFGN
jgi:hypothetical protein